MSELIVEILEDFLGKPKKHYKEKSQISFDCPVCSTIKGLDCGDGKGNLEVNYNHHVYKCWACSETYGTHGTLNKLVKKYGNRNHIKQYRLVIPEDKKVIVKNNSPIITGLPKEFTPLILERGSFDHKEAIKYLSKRNIKKDLIEKYNLGYAVTGDYKGRIIFPSYDSNGEINYFLGRSYSKYSKLKYKNPEVQKDTIIFNEPNIDWEKEIYLVEGVFDMFFLDNAIPILGKVISDKLWETLYEKSKNDIIICLDGDAWNDGVKLFDKLNGGKLRGRIKIVKMPKNKDVADLGGKINKDKIVSLEK